MNPRNLTALLAAIVLSAGSGAAFAQQNSPVIPVGKLSAFPTIVQTGTHPQLSWSVTVPESVVDVVTIVPPGTIKPKRDLVMDVRILGASVKAVWTNSAGQVTKWEWVPTECLFSYNGGSYSRIFYNTQNNVNPNTIARTQTVAVNQTVNFGGRYYHNNAWSTTYTSTNGQYNVVALKNGDTPPTTTPLYQQPTIESFILPYLDSQGRIKLGPRDVIYLMELTHTNRNDPGFDLQDLVILTTFRDVPPPSGHTGAEWFNTSTMTYGNATTTGSFNAAGTLFKTTSTQNLSKIVLQFADGTSQTINSPGGKTGSFQGTGSNAGKVIVGAWVKSGTNSNSSGSSNGAYHQN